jgi:hypothetical protein
MIGFLTDLGIQANPTTTYAQVLTEGVPSGVHVRGTDRFPIQGKDFEIVGPLAHDFVLAFRNWAESCIKILDDMITREYIPAPSADGRITTKLLYSRVLEMEQAPNHPAMSGSPNIGHLLAWKESLKKTRSCSSIEGMLELFLGVPGASHTILWPGLSVTGYEPYYWPRCHLTRGKVMGRSSAFVTRLGYFAMGPTTVLAGDVVVVLFGCNVPVVIRPIGNQFTLFGQCYVEGLMDGQVLDLMHEGRALKRLLEIVKEH